MQLYSYFRSSASYRVRIALNLKGISCNILPVHLLKNGGEQHGAVFRAANPQGLVPVLQDGDVQITQSLAIIEYLDEIHPVMPLLPGDVAGRARVRSLAQLIACDIHPLNNLRVLQYLSSQLGVGDEQKTGWIRHWVESGLAALERRLANEPATGRFCHGDTPGLADCCLVPQVFNAQRFGCDLSAMPVVSRINDACLALPAFFAAAPSQQPDAE